MITDLDIERTFCLSNTLNFTRYMFKQKTGQKFIIGEHHRQICHALDDVVRGKIKRLIINIAPRYGKTELVCKNFIAYGLALNPASRFLHLSYSDDLVLETSKEIHETINAPYYQLLFPDTVIEGKSAKLWHTTKRGGLYAVSSGGQVTGFGAGQVEAEDNITDFLNPAGDFSGAIIIDDPIKPDDALSDVIRERVNNRFESTIRNRVNSRNTPIIIIMQRLHENDLCGYLKRVEPNEWHILSLPCLSADNEGNLRALWPHKHNIEELNKLKRIDSYVFETQYQQNPTPIEGLMYSTFKEYETLPIGRRLIKNCTDTADTGADYLCSICYAEYKTGIYILDVLYTNKPMEYTEIETAKMIHRNKVVKCHIESNNGGRSFARAVEENLRKLGNYDTAIIPYQQTANKQTRIFTESAKVQNLIYYPKDWHIRWPAFYNAVKSYRKEGRNLHDDAPDTLTAIIENFGGGRVLTEEEILRDML